MIYIYNYIYIMIYIYIHNDIYIYNDIDMEIYKCREVDRKNWRFFNGGIDLIPQFQWPSVSSSVWLSRIS